MNTTDRTKNFNTTFHSFRSFEFSTLSLPLPNLHVYKLYLSSRIHINYIFNCIHLFPGFPIGCTDDYN